MVKTTWIRRIKIIRIRKKDEIIIRIIKIKIIIRIRIRKKDKIIIRNWEIIIRKSKKIYLKLLKEIRKGIKL